MPLANAGAPQNPAGRKSHGVPPEIDRDGWDRPKIVLLDPKTGRPHVDPDGKPLRQVGPFVRPSTMGEMCEDQRGLGMWRAAVALWGAFRAIGVSFRLSVLAIRGYDDKADKSALYQLVERAQKIADIDHAAAHGTALHAIFEQVDKGLDIPDVGQDQQTVDAYARAIAPFEIVDSERFVVIDTVVEDGRTLTINAAGTLDRRIRITRPTAVLDKAGDIIGVLLPGDIIVVDIKTNSAADYYGVKYRLQCWLYAHGRGYDHTTGERHDLGTRTDFALILHVPAGGDAASFYWVDLRGGIDLAATAMKVREHRNAGKRAIWPADLDVEVPPELVEQAIVERGTAADYTPPSAAGVPDVSAGPAGPARDDGPFDPHPNWVLDGIAAEVGVARTRRDLGAVWERWESQWSPAAQDIVEARMRELGIPVKVRA